MTQISAILGGLAACIVALAAFIGGLNTTVSVSPVNDVFGAAGGDFYSLLYAHDNIVIGGKVIASSTVVTQTLAATDVVGVKLLNAKAASAATLTLPTKSVLSAAGFLPIAGDSAEMFIHASTSAVTLSGGTGVKLSTNASSTIVYPDTTVKITFTRLSAGEGSTFEAVITGPNK